ncbi:hypothetical protein C8Q76DRAFT_704108 [Earliella scabrosa]|nr:hypothetical protein C8Q76DRAFT_704108 [Earliella scabrosa]
MTMTTPQRSRSVPLVQYIDLNNTHYTYCDSTLIALHPKAIAYLSDVGYCPEPRRHYTVSKTMELFTELSVELFQALARTDYVLAQRSAFVPESNISSSVTRPALGLMFEPIASPKRDCMLSGAQLQIVDEWRIKFDALVWLENVATGRHGVAFPQHQQQQRNLQLSKMLHDVNRWLVDWDNQGRGCGQRPVAAKLARRLEEENGSDESTYSETRWTKRMKRSHEHSVASAAWDVRRCEIAAC